MASRKPRVWLARPTCIGPGPCAGIREGVGEALVGKTGDAVCLRTKISASLGHGDLGILYQERERRCVPVRGHTSYGPVADCHACIPIHNLFS